MSGPLTHQEMRAAAVKLEKLAARRKPEGSISVLAETPIAVLSNGGVVYGTHDTDGTPFTVCYTAEEGHLHASVDGVTGEWAGEGFEITPTQFYTWQRLFTGNLLHNLLEISEHWTGEEIADRSPTPATLMAGISVLAILEVELTGRLPREEISALISKVAKVLDQELDVFDYETTSTLDKVMKRRKAQRGA